MLVGRLRRDKDAEKVGVGPHRAALAGGGTKIVDQHPDRYAGAAALARRPVGDRLRAAEAGLGQEVVERGRPLADQMGEDFPLLLAGQVGACRRSGEIELRGVARFPGHAFSQLSARFRWRRPAIFTNGAKAVGSEPPDDHDAGDDVVQASLLGVDQRDQKDRREAPADVEQHRLDRRVDERNPRARCRSCAFRDRAPACRASPCCGPETVRPL